MEIFDAIRANVLSPAVLFFVLGLIAALTKSELKFPEPLYVGLTIYLLIAIGFKGGVAIADAGFAKVWFPAIAAMVLGALIPLWTYPLLRFGGKLPGVDAAAIAAHYGSVSAVTFIAATCEPPIGRYGFRVYHADLSFDFRTKGGGIAAHYGITNGLRSNTRNAHRLVPAGARGQPRRFIFPAGRQTGRAGTASTLAAPRGRNPPSSCPFASPSTCGSPTRSLGSSLFRLSTTRPRACRRRYRRARHTRNSASGRHRGFAGTKHL